MAYIATPLTSNWRFKQGNLTSSSTYLPAHNVPTEVHRDLLKNHKIADPFLDLNELSVRWVAEETWTYQTTFPTPQDISEEQTKTTLKFEGLDTFASVYLNGHLILKSDNMFLEYRVDVSSEIRAGGTENTLEIVFEPALKKGLELVRQHPEHNFIVHQTEVSRGPVRKAQYHWGWDWGPILMSCGPWKPITLESYAYRIDNVWVEYELSDDLTKVTGKLFAKVEGQRPDALEVTFSLTEKAIYDDGGVYKGRHTGNGVFEASFSVDAPVELWWPRGYGHQTLYDIKASVSHAVSNVQYHSASKTIGFRKVELIQNKDSIGTSFYFRVNNVDIFAGGSCWIPADSFLTRVTAERYHEWIQLAAESNQNMIRVWGGGIYESDAFYSACDELGILVWQDFMFACANYPAYADYLKSVEQEARQNARRMRHHPCIALWCGNNEDYQIVERYGLQYDVENLDPEAWLQTNFPARYIYEYLLPKVVMEEAVGTPYHPSSPFGNGKSTTLKVDPTIGDIHQWNVWHGSMEPYQRFPAMGGRFVSEFGMEAYPHLETLEKCITREEDRYPGSMAMDFRNKAIGHERRLVSYVAENFRMKADFPGFAHLTQVMQADAMGWAYRSWRRDWGRSGERACGGVLVWQLNDCWPTVSWSVVDYYLVPKPAYYAIKREMEPIVIGVARSMHDWTKRPADELWKRDTGHIDPTQCLENVHYAVWVSSSKLEEVKAKIVVKFISIRTGKEVFDELTFYKDIQLNGTTEVVSARTADPFVISASLEVEAVEISNCISWPDPIKYLHFPDRDVQMRYSDDGASVTVTVGKPVKGFVFSERQGVRLSDNGFDLVPGVKKTVQVKGVHASKLDWRYVGM
ncbi:glycoside hydrolase [Westerdykella ornata]|uniref:Beta-mannosidase B n=1 Tax=Westerdykella ornata TaxID=318751 RepID=A0A6A6JVN0_WESOR|nr:glycoside hydrolase [Westerdykella ornata]KAF2279109.1 glycoside hydrolase [Westerdykella ornata]